MTRRSHWVGIVAKLLVSFLILSIACKTRNQYPRVEQLISRDASCEVNPFLAEKLLKSRMLVVADQDPSDWRYKETVVDFLDYWSLSYGFDSRLDSLRNITLVLKCNSSFLSRAMTYMETWDYRDLGDATSTCSRTVSTSDLEFYWRLGNIKHRIVDHNSRSGPEQQLRFEIIPIDSKSDSAGGQWECLPVDVITEYEANDPSANFLALWPAPFFVNGARFGDYEDVITSAPKPIACTDSAGENREPILVVGRTTTDSWPGYYDELDSPDCDYIITSAETSGIINREIGLAACDIDALIVTKFEYELRLPTIAVPSANIVRMFIDEMPGVTDTSNQSNQRCWPAMITYLGAVSGVVPEPVDITDESALVRTMRHWQHWADTTEINSVNDVVSLRIWTRLIDQLAGAPEAVARQYELEIEMILPGAPEFDGRFGAPSQAERAAMVRNYLMRNQDDIVIKTLINILWVGDQSEKGASLKALTTKTGMRFLTPCEWSEWYRSGKKEPLETVLRN